MFNWNLSNVFLFKELEKKFKEQHSGLKMLETIITKSMYFFLFFFHRYSRFTGGGRESAFGFGGVG